MKHIIILTLTVFFASSSISFAQKAYENITYKGNFKGKKITFLLADGYIGASVITLQSNKKIDFNPEAASVNENGTLKFLHYITPLKASKNYFILYGISENYKEIPKRIFGEYLSGKKRFKITLIKLK